MSEHQDDRIMIELPAEPSAVGSARLFATSVARLAGIDDETVEDVRLAISEAVTERIHAAGATASPVCVIALVRGKDVVFEISGAGGAPGDNGELGMAVIRSLFPDATLESSPHVVRFVAPRAG